MPSDDGTPVEPTVYGFSMAVDSDGDVWVSAPDVVTYLRAAILTMGSMTDLSIADVACAFTIEADALELRSRELATQNPPEGFDT